MPNPGLFLILISLFCWSAVARPVIHKVLDGAAYTIDIAAGSVFVIKGTGLSTEGYATADAPNYPQTLNSVSITFNQAGSNPVRPYLIYTYNLDGVNQLAALLPSDTSPGFYSVTVSNPTGTSVPVQVRVVSRKPGLVSADGTGSGPAQATTAGWDLIRFAGPGNVGNYPIRAAQRGESVVLWGTGFGPDFSSDPPNGAGSGDLRSKAIFKVIIDGIEVNPDYAGRSPGIPGLDQINFVIPARVVPSCAVTVVIKIDAVYSNRLTLAVAQPGQTTCPSEAFSAAELLHLSQGGTLPRGMFTINSHRMKHIYDPEGKNYFETFYGMFANVGANFIAQEATSLRFGQCRTWATRGNAADIELGQLHYSQPMDAGSTLALSAPLGTVNVGKYPAPRVNEYGGLLTNNIPQSLILPGQYTVSGNGGVDVGPFQASLDIPTFDWTNSDELHFVNRNQSLPIKWSGNSSGGVIIQGLGVRTVAGDARGANGHNAILEATYFVCAADGAAGQFTVPSSILRELPEVPVTDSAFNIIYSGISVTATRKGELTNFSAPLNAGGSINGWFVYTRTVQRQLEIR